MPAGNEKSAYPSAYMTSYAYLLSSGVILMPVIFIAAFLRPSWFKKKDSIVLLTAMFYYCVIIIQPYLRKKYYIIITMEDILCHI